ncbi:MAG: hypothetical protein KDC87_14485 [Planctomycetes bacterium]|nr:hypothetical protein [Planctomycetota bacterium]
MSILWVGAVLSTAVGLAAQRPTPTRPELLDTYHALAKRIEPTDTVRQFALARWCAQHRLARCLQWQLHVVLRSDPNHAEARALLGQVFHAGRWQPRAVAMRAQGLVEFEGRWMRRYDLARLRHARQQQARADAVRQQSERLFVRLADPDPATRHAALQDLEALAAAERSPELCDLGRRLAAAYAAHWRRRAAGSGLLTVQAQHAQLLGMRTFTTSLGNGAPVRLQLPTVRTVSIQTAIPLH